LSHRASAIHSHRIRSDGEFMARQRRIMQTAIIVSTYKKRENIADLVGQILSLDIVIPLIVEDDNSPDGTDELTAEMAACDRHVRVVHRPGKLGLGSVCIL
jgi:dolichol-phosphate mannosyltransferase